MLVEANRKAMLTLSLCVCTKDRPAELRRLLESIQMGSALPQSVFVSDDSNDSESTSSLCRDFGLVRYSKGPSKGLCANRNAVVTCADTDYISLIDDDAIISEHFVRQLKAILPELDGRTLITGDVLEYGGRSTPKDPSFWGHFVNAPNGSPRTISLNSNGIPRSAFTVAAFDESLVYGYEDMDLCSQLLRRGYSIRYVPSLVNEHVPPLRTGEVDTFRYRYTQQARFRTSMMRYLVWEGKAHMALLYFTLAPLHRAAYDLKTKRFSDLITIPFDIVSATIAAVRCLVKR